MTLMTAIIPTYSRYDLLTTCIDGLLNQTLGNIEIIIVDNASKVNIQRIVERRYGARVTTLRLHRNFFFCGAVNHGATLAKSDYIAVLNDDCMVSPGWAETVLETFARYPSAGSVASLVLNASDKELINSAGDHLDISGRPTNLYWNQRASQVSLSITQVFSAAGSCAAYRRDAFEAAGKFDNDFAAYLDDIDLGFRLQLLGYTTIFNPSCTAVHVGGGTPKTRRYAAYLLERNMIWNLVKNLPGELWQRHRRKILAAQSVPAPLVDGVSVAGWTKGKAGAVLGIQKMLNKRQQIQHCRRISIDDLEELLLRHDTRQCHL
jgi:GT2 family glycosyltransferase